MLTTVLKSLWSRKRRLVGTGIPVVLGVAFLAATMIVGDTTEAGFTQTFTAANDGTAVIVRNATAIGGGDARSRGLIDESMVDAIAAVDGVAAAVPEIEGVAQVVGADGEPIGGDGPPTIATNWIDDPALSWLTLDEGRAPGGDGEVVIDRATAAAGDLAVGDTTALLTPRRVPVTVVGVATFGGVERIGGVTYVAFDTDTAQRILAGDADRISAVRVRAVDGVDAVELKARIGAGLPDGVEAITGAELTAEQEAIVESDLLGVLKTMLLAFAGIAMVVAAFSIHNTFAILVAQRSRESALLRAIGASRRQIIVGVATEALAVGVVATAIGFGAGIGIAAVLNNVMQSGLGTPSASMVIGGAALIATAVVGIGITLVASVGPALKASRVAPLAALRDIAVDRAAASRTRAVVGGLLAAAGVATLLTATSTPDAALTRAGLGCLGLLVGVVVLGPVVARPAAAVLGAPPAATRGVAGQLARRNTMRNPRRTAASASALLVGTAVVGLFTTFGASLKASLDATVDDNFAGDLIVIPDGFSGALLDPQMAPAIADVPDVNAAIGSAYGPALVDGETVDVAGTDVAGLGTVFDVGVSAGSFDDFTTGDIAVSEHYAEDHDLGVGSTVAASWPDGGGTEFTVAAVYTDRMTFGDLIVSSTDLADHRTQADDTVVLVDLVAGADPHAAKAAVAGVTAEFGAPDPLDRAEYKDSIGQEINSLLYVVYGLLGVAVVIALMGIANTLSLSIHERTREIGLLRAVGQDRRQVRSTVRWESVITSVFGTAGGVGLGTLFGWGLMRAMKAQEGFGEFALPVGPIAVVMVLAAGAGVVAAIRPARRAAGTDILLAIA